MYIADVHRVQHLHDGSAAHHPAELPQLEDRAGDAARHHPPQQPEHGAAQGRGDDGSAVRHCASPGALPLSEDIYQSV